MAVTALLYDNFALNCMRKLVSDMTAAGTSIKVALCTSSYTPNQANHTSFNDIDNEITGVGYTAGGVALSNKTLVAATRVVTFDADDAAWLNSTLTARYAIIYDDTPTGATNKKLIGYINFGQDYTSVAATFSLIFNASGILTWTVT